MDYLFEMGNMLSSLDILVKKLELLQIVPSPLQQFYTEAIWKTNLSPIPNRYPTSLKGSNAKMVLSKKKNKPVHHYLYNSKLVEREIEVTYWVELQ